MRKVGIRDVAKEAGVSTATVSYVLNKKENQSVSEETKKKVLEAVEKLGYIPNLSARTLSNSKSNLIGVVIPQTEEGQNYIFNNPFYSEFLSSFEFTARKAGYHVLISGTNPDEEYIEVAKKRNLDGIVVLGVYPKKSLEKIKASNIPTVVVDSYIEKYHFSTVRSDDRYEAYKAVKYLINKGHKKIFAISGDTKQKGVSQERIKGYEDAMKEAGLDFENSIFTTNVDLDYSYKLGMNIFSGKSLPTAVFCTADILALGMIKSIREKGLTVPDNISVMGFDDVVLSKISYPALTTVKQNISLKAEKSALTIIGIIEKQITDKQSIIISGEIVERDTVKEMK